MLRSNIGQSRSGILPLYWRHVEPAYQSAMLILALFSFSPVIEWHVGKVVSGVFLSQSIFPGVVDPGVSVTVDGCSQMRCAGLP